MWSQVGLRKHHYKQSWWMWWNSSCAISNPKRWYCESAALNIPANLENSQWPQDWKRSVFIPIPKKGNAKECSPYRTLHSSHTLTSNAQNSPSKASTVCELWISRCFSKRQRNQGSNCQHPLDHQKSKRVPEKHVSALLAVPKPLTVWITTNWKILQEMGYQTTLLVSWEICMQLKKQQLELNMEQWTSSKSGKSMSRLYTVILLI